MNTDKAENLCTANKSKTKKNSLKPQINADKKPLNWRAVSYFNSELCRRILCTRRPFRFSLFTIYERRNAGNRINRPLSTFTASTPDASHLSAFICVHLRSSAVKTAFRFCFYSRSSAVQIAFRFYLRFKAFPLYPCLSVFIRGLVFWSGVAAAHSSRKVGSPSSVQLVTWSSRPSSRARILACCTASPSVRPSSCAVRTSRATRSLWS